MSEAINRPGHDGRPVFAASLKPKPKKPERPVQMDTIRRLTGLTREQLHEIHDKGHITKHLSKRGTRRFMLSEVKAHLESRNK
jgi:hypothetical protein